MTKIYVVRASGGEWSDSWTTNICAKYSVEDAEQFIKDRIKQDAKANKDAAILQAEEDRWGEENDYEYEDIIPIFELGNDVDALKLAELKAINAAMMERNHKKHIEFYEKCELHMDQFAKDNNLTRGGSEYEEVYYTFDEIELL